MTTIAAAPAPLAFADPPAAPTVAGGGDTFAPVLASLLATTAIVSPRPPIAAGTVAKPGTPLPPPGSPLPPGVGDATDHALPDPLPIDYLDPQPIVPGQEPVDAPSADLPHRWYAGKRPSATPPLPESPAPLPTLIAGTKEGASERAAADPTTPSTTPTLSSPAIQYAAIAGTPTTAPTGSTPPAPIGAEPKPPVADPRPTAAPIGTIVAPAGPAPVQTAVELPVAAIEAGPATSATPPKAGPSPALAPVPSDTTGTPPASAPDRVTRSRHDAAPRPVRFVPAADPDIEAPADHSEQSPRKGEGDAMAALPSPVPASFAPQPDPVVVAPTIPNPAATVVAGAPSVDLAAAADIKPARVRTASPPVAVIPTKAVLTGNVPSATTAITQPAPDTGSQPLEAPAPRGSLRRSGGGVAETSQPPVAAPPAPPQLASEETAAPARPAAATISADVVQSPALRTAAAQLATAPSRSTTDAVTPAAQRADAPAPVVARRDTTPPEQPVAVAPTPAVRNAAPAIAQGSAIAPLPPIRTPVVSEPRPPFETTPVRAAAPVAAPRAEIPAPTAAAILPALQTFGAALHRAVVAERRPVRATDPQAIAALAPTAAPAATLTAPVDTTQPRWPETMVARIEAIRDAQDAPGTASDARIRLHPDALGAVDVTLRQDAGGTHVQLHAAEPATRALLADAQPRLQEFAETRGLRLAGTDITGGGTQGQGWTGSDRRQSAPAPMQQSVRRPAPAPAAATDDSTDTRIA